MKRGKKNHFHFPVLKNGQECYCFEVLPFDSIDFIKDVDEESFCNVDCSGWNATKCGGQSSYSVYIASIFLF